MGHLHKLSLVGSHFGNCIYQQSPAVIVRDKDCGYSGQKSQRGCCFSPNVSFISIKLFICMYAYIAIFNPKVINNLDGDNNSVQSEVRIAAPSNAYLDRTCHPKDGFGSLQGECIWLSNFHSNISQMELIPWDGMNQPFLTLTYGRQFGKVGKNIYMMWGYSKRGYAQFQMVNRPISKSAEVNQKVITRMSFFFSTTSVTLKVWMC